MKIANADKLKHHFEHVVMVKHFTVPEILTIINTFSVEIPEGHELIFHQEGNEIIITDLNEKRKLDSIFGGTKP